MGHLNGPLMPGICLLIAWRDCKSSPTMSCHAMPLHARTGGWTSCTRDVPHSCSTASSAVLAPDQTHTPHALLLLLQNIDKATNTKPYVFVFVSSRCGEHQHWVLSTAQALRANPLHHLFPSISGALTPCMLFVCVLSDARCWVCRGLLDHLATKEDPAWLNQISNQFNAVMIVDALGYELVVSYAMVEP